MPRPKLPKEERKLKLDVRLKQKYINELKSKLRENETLSDFIERIIVNFLKNN